jgi:hypothetical protein
VYNLTLTKHISTSVYRACIFLVDCAEANPVAAATGELHDWADMQMVVHDSEAGEGDKTPTGAWDMNDDDEEHVEDDEPGAACASSAAARQEPQSVTRRVKRILCAICMESSEAVANMDVLGHGNTSPQPGLPLGFIAFGFCYLLQAVPMERFPWFPRCVIFEAL